MNFSPPRYALLSAAINSVLYGTFSFVDLHTLTSTGLKTASYKTFDHTKCEVTCDTTDPNCARVFPLKASTGIVEGDADFEAWQNCKNLCTDLHECTGFDIQEREAATPFYSCTLYYQFIHTCDYQVGHMCSVKECNTPMALDASTNAQCFRLNNADEWGMLYPMLWQQPLQCPAENLYCKREGELCDNEKSYCRENEDLICAPDCRQYSVCKRVAAVDPLMLVTHALLQCPFVEPASVPEAVVIAPEAPKPTDWTGTITQDALANGTYMITRPGTYKIMEDLTFEFQEAPFTSHSHRGLHAGKIIGIAILADDVILDLNGKTLKQSGSHFRKQRFFTHIVIGNQVFSKGVGNFKSDLVPRKRIVIKNGKLGLTSHFGIRGMKSQDIVVENVEFRNVEVAAVSFSASARIRIQQCTIDNSDFQATVSYRFGVFFQLFRTMRFLESNDVKDPVGTSPQFPSEFFSHSIVANMILDKSGSSAVESRAINEFVAKPAHLSEGNMYGIHVTNCDHVEVNDVDINHLSNMHSRVKAVRMFGENGPVFNADKNALLYNWFWDDEGNRIDNKESMSELESLQVFLFKAQVWAMKQFGNVLTNGIDDNFVSRVLDPAKPEMRDVLPWSGNDIRGHIDSGVHAISIKSNSHFVKIINVRISGVYNTVPRQNASSTWSASVPGGFLSSAPNVWRGSTGSHRINHAADAYGISIDSSTHVSVKDISIRDIRSESMHAFGVAVIGKSKNVGVSSVSVDAGSLQVGGLLRTQNLTLPNLKAKAMPFYRDSVGQQNVKFQTITPKHLYVAASANCDFSPTGTDCPGDGNWEKSKCDGEIAQTPVHCKATVSECDPETCRITITKTDVAANGGKPCSYDDGASYQCCKEEVPLETTHAPVSCIGRWSVCDINCFKTYIVSRPSRFGGSLCPHSAGEEKACSDTAGCKSTTNPDAHSPVNCVFEVVGECDEKCTKQVNIIRPAQNGGTPCPDFSALNKRIRADCNGSGTDGKCMPSENKECDAYWGACDTSTCLKRWAIQNYPAGAYPSCPYAHGAVAQCDQIDAASCKIKPKTQNCIGRWSECNPLTCTAVFVVTQSAVGEGQDCTYEAGELAGYGTDLDHLLVCPVAKKCGTTSPGPSEVCRWGDCMADCSRIYKATRDDCPIAHGTVDISFCRGGMGACRAKHCEGSWSSCGADCMRTFTISQAPAFGGSECSQVANTKSPSDCFVDGVGKNSCAAAPSYTNTDCKGSYTESCNAACMLTFVVSAMQQGSGAICTTPSGHTSVANCDQQNCADTPEDHQDCVYKWGECNTSCKRTFAVVSAPTSPFSMCPYPDDFQSVTDCAAGKGYCPCPADNPTCAEGCGRWTVPDTCSADGTCYWNKHASRPVCEKDECVHLGKDACVASQDCFVDIKNSNRCTMTNCHTHTSQQLCESDAICLFDAATNKCVYNACNDHDVVTCDGQALCAFDRNGGICRPDKCAHLGKNQKACVAQTALCRMGTAEIATKFPMLDLIYYTTTDERYTASPLHPDFDPYTAPSAQTCIPSHCDAAKSPEECAARDYCYVANASPLSCLTNRCAALGFAGTSEACNAIDECSHNGRYCYPVATCAVYDGESDACRAADCVYNIATSKCVSHKCSTPSLQASRASCNAENMCFFKDRRFDRSVSARTQCRATTCEGLTAAQCVAGPECYVDRQDGSTCRVNPCMGTATGEDDCNNALCGWQSASERCAPKPFPTAPCDTLQSDMVQCEISPHCYIEDGVCRSNPCSGEDLATCAPPHCFINHSVGSVCKPAKPCGQRIAFYGDASRCTKNPLCKNKDAACARKPCTELSESECKFSFASNTYCTYVGKTCKSNICAHFNEKECKASKPACAWDVHYVPTTDERTQCVQNPCHGLKQDACKEAAECHLSGSGACAWNSCVGYSDKAKCEADPTCFFAENTCKKLACNGLGHDRELCLAQAECTHIPAKKECAIDPCVHYSATKCDTAPGCVYNPGTGVCTPTTLCAGLSVANCHSARLCFYNSVEKTCSINFCQFPDKESCEKTTNKHQCAWALKNSDANAHKCVHNPCDGMEKVNCRSTDVCFWGAVNAKSTSKTCYFDKCKIFSEKKCGTMENCQWREGICKPNKSCVGALWSDSKCGDGKILVNPGVKLCTSCSLQECCEDGDRPGPAPRSTGGINGLMIGIIITVVLLFLLFLFLFIFFFCIKKEQSGQEVEANKAESHIRE